MVCDLMGSIFTKHKHKVFIFIFSNLLVSNPFTSVCFSCIKTSKRIRWMFIVPFFNRNRWLQLFLFRKKEYIVFKNSWYTNGLFIVLNAKVRELFYLDLVTYSWSFLRTIVYHEWRLLNFVLCSKNLNEVISFYE